MTGGATVPGAAKIAVLRATALGDFIFALPALDALRAAYPDAQIVLLARAWHRALLDGRPRPVDRVVPLPDGSVGDEARRDASDDERQTLIERLREERFDLALQMHGGGRTSNGFLRSLGAGVTAGCRTPDAPGLDRNLRYVYSQSEVMRALEIVGLVGARPVTLQPTLAVTEADRAAAEAAVPDDGRPLAVLHPGATDRRRRWPAERFAALARLLVADGCAVVVTGDESERELTGSVARDASGSVDAGGRLSLSGLIGLLARALVVVSNDTGPLHVADAVGTPTVGIYWCGNLINGGTPLRARHTPLASWRQACPSCGADNSLGRCPHDPSFVADVPLEVVAAAALEHLGWASAPVVIGR